MQYCIERRYTHELRLHVEGLCLGEQAALEHGIEDVEVWARDYARAYFYLQGFDYETLNGFIVDDETFAFWEAWARRDFRQRCGEVQGRSLHALVGPRDYAHCVGRVAEIGEEAAERYLPCTLLQNGEIQSVRVAADLGYRWTAPE